MKRRIGFFMLLIPLILTGCSSANNSKVDMSVREISLTTDTYDMLDKARSAVVGIAVELNDGYAIGTGVAISDGGYILTNFHVIEGEKDITLYFADKTTGSASVLWGDSNLDLAVLKSSREIPYLATTDLDDVYIGEEIYSIGTPLTLEFKHTVTKGIVSAIDRILESESSYGTSYLQSLIQHDASINPGNSGGPLITKNGEVIGINTLKANEGEGIGFAVPIILGKVVVEKLKENENYTTPYLGIFAFDSELAEVYGYNFNEEGVYVVSTSDNAKTSGLKNGDLITAINNKKIKNMLDFRVEIFSRNIGETINISYIRNGIKRNVDVVLTKR